MKQQIRLNESQLRQIVKESVRKMLKESGHLYWKDDDGTVHTNSKETWRGVPGTTYISHGEWSDAEVWYEGVEFNAEQLDEEFWVVFEDHMSQDDIREEFIKDTGCDGEINYENYNRWLQWMGVDWIQDNLNELVWAKQESGELNEGFVNNVTQGAKSFFGKGSAGANNQKNNNLRSQNGGLNLGKRFNAAKTNYQMTKEGGKINDVIQFLEDMVAKKQLTPQTTIADLIGGRLNNNKYGRLHAMRDNRTSRASRAQNNIYR